MYTKSIKKQSSIWLFFISTCFLKKEFFTLITNHKEKSMKENKFSLYTDMTPEQALSQLKTSQDGLSESQAAERLTAYGLNEIREHDITWFDIFKAQLFSPFMSIFFVIALAYICTKQVAESTIIFIIIIINVGIGFSSGFLTLTVCNRPKRFDAC